MNPEMMKKQALLDIKPIVFGEQIKEGIIKGNPVEAKNPCVFCDKPVWISDIGYNVGDPEKDISFQDEKMKACHKMCFHVLAEMMFPAVLQKIWKQMNTN